MAGLVSQLTSGPLLQPVLLPSCCYTHSCCHLDVFVIAAHASTHQSCRYLSLLSSSCIKRLGGGLADSGPLLRDSDVQAVLGSNVLPVFRLLHAEVAAAAAVLAKNIRLARGHTPVSLCCTVLHLAGSCRATLWRLDACASALSPRPYTAPCCELIPPEQSACGHLLAENSTACTVFYAGGRAAMFVVCAWQSICS